MVYQIRTKICKQCGIEFSKRIPETREFCSVRCRQAYRNDPARNPAKTLEARKKISDSRKGKPTSLGIPCPESKKRKISRTLKGRPTGRKPSQKTIDAWAKAGAKNLIHGVTGPDHPAWKGGHAKTRQARYKEPEYIEWHNKCLERDKYTCQYCDAKNGGGEQIYLQVHHKIHYWERLDLAYNLDNGITLCKSCHQKAHKGMERVDISTYKGKLKVCVVCDRKYLSKQGGRKFCSECREKYCCSVCGSTKCAHLARTKSKQPLPL